MKSAWIIPILQDLRNFAEENRMAELADDIESVIVNNRSAILSLERNGTSNIVSFPDRRAQRTADADA